MKHLFYPCHPSPEDLTSLGIGKIQEENTTGAPLSNFAFQQEKKSHLVAMLQPLGGKAQSRSFRKTKSNFHITH